MKTGTNTAPVEIPLNQAHHPLQQKKAVALPFFC